jgi:EamA domain-containing membrane protein RarD
MKTVQLEAMHKGIACLIYFLIRKALRERERESTLIEPTLVAPMAAIATKPSFHCPSSTTYGYHKYFK